MTPTITEADEYLDSRTGCIEYRAIRYREAMRAMKVRGLLDTSTIYDIGAGWTELDYILRTEGDWKGRYIPIDAGIDGTDLEFWTVPRPAEFAVALELLEHLWEPFRLIQKLQARVNHIIASVPNPRTVDVLGIDPTHVTIIEREQLEDWGFEVSERTFYGGVFSNGEPDSLFAVWDRI